MSFAPGEVRADLVKEINDRNVNEGGPGKELVFHGHHQRVNNLVASSATADVALTRKHAKIATGTTV